MKEEFNEQVVDTIELTDAVKIVFYYDFFNEKFWANIRKFVKSKKYTGPTKQGIKFDPAKLPEIKNAIDKANAALRQQLQDIQKENEVLKAENRELNPKNTL